MSHRMEETMTDDMGVDMELRAALRLLDPGHDDGDYWSRFGDLVARSVAPELERRQRLAAMSVGDVLAGWARTLVPTAMLAAAIAGVALMRAPASEGPVFLGIEELLVSELTGITIPQIAPDAPGNPVTLAAELF